MGLESLSTWEESSLKCPPVTHVSHNNLKKKHLYRKICQTCQSGKLLLRFIGLDVVSNCQETSGVMT